MHIVYKIFRTLEFKYATLKSPYLYSCIHSEVANSSKTRNQCIHFLHTLLKKCYNATHWDDVLGNRTPLLKFKRRCYCLLISTSVRFGHTVVTPTKEIRPVLGKLFVDKTSLNLIKMRIA